MSPTTWSSASSATHQGSFFLPYPVIGPGHRRRLRSASCSLKHTENMPITAIQRACQSVSRHCLLSSIEQGNLWEKEMSINQLVLGSRETRTVLTASFLKTPKLRMWSIEQGSLRSEIAQNAKIRTLLEEQRRDDYRRVLRENWTSRTPSSSSRRRTPNSTRRTMASGNGFS